ncbi:MAG: hypothetical protein ACE5FA_04045 [Dehalococcoidia bacterium]
MSGLLQWIAARGAERSTWLGLIGLISAFGVNLKPELTEGIIALGLALAGLVATLTKDKLPPA